MRHDNDKGKKNKNDISQVFAVIFLLFSRLTMETTDPTIGMTSLTLDLDRTTDHRKSQTSLLSITSDDVSY
jgi:hypothetical protein